MNRYDLINVKTGEIREDLKARTIASLLDMNVNDVAYYERNELIYDNTYKITFARNLKSDCETSIPNIILEEWDKVTSKFRRYYNERVL